MIPVDRLPFPIARLYSEMEEQTDPGRKFRALIRTFAGLLKSTSLIAVSDYLASGASDDAVDALLAGRDFERPSLGHWNGFLRSILKCSSSDLSLQVPPAPLAMPAFSP